MNSSKVLCRKVLHLSGKDTKAALQDFFSLLNDEQAKLLHFSQSCIHECLVINAEIEGESAEALVHKAGQFASKHSLHLDVTDFTSPSRCEPTQGIWVTILGDLSSALALTRISTVLVSQGLTISHVNAIGDDKMHGVHLLATQYGEITQANINRLRSDILALGTELKVDLAVQRDDVYRGSKRLLCMDVDSTFVKGEFIDELAELCNVKSQVAEITARAMRGELDFEGSLRQRVQLLKGLPVSRARELCDRFELTPGAADLVATVKQLGMRVGLVSGGFDFFVETLKSRFGLDFAFANELEVLDDKLTGRVVGTVVDSARKAQILKDMSHVFDIRLEQTIAAGDGANDIEMLKTAGLGIAYQAKPKLQEIADTRFNQNDRLDTLLYLMGYDPKQLVRVCRR